MTLFEPTSHVYGEITPKKISKMSEDTTIIKKEIQYIQSDPFSGSDPGLVPASTEETQAKYLRGDGSWGTPAGGGGGTEDYEDLANKPSINGVTLEGALTANDLNIHDASLEDSMTSAVDVGGISAGKTYPAGTSLSTILSDMLEPTLFPTFTAPSAGLAYSASQYYAVGATVSAATATVSLNRGAITPAYGTSGYRSGAANGFSIATSGADTEYSNTSESSGSFNVPALTRATKGNIVITGTASYDAGEQPKDSKGGDYSSPLAAGTVSATKTLTFIQPYYYGAVDSASISDFTGLTENVTAKGQKTFNYTTNNQYMVFAYDSSYGNLKTILDGNGFDVTGGWTKSTKTVDGFTYNVYISNSPTTDTNAPFTFKY